MKLQSLELADEKGGTIVNPGREWAGAVLWLGLLRSPAAILYCDCGGDLMQPCGLRTALRP